MPRGMLVLMYHRILASLRDAECCGPGERKYAVTERTLEAQINVAKTKGEIVRAAQYHDAVNAADERIRCLLTFDDSPDTHYSHAFPTLQRIGVDAVFFVTAGEIGGKGKLTWPQLREMSQAGMVIQSHGFSHRFMTQMGEDELRNELVRSRRALEEGLGAPVKALSFPGGRYDVRVIEAATTAGYERLFTSDIGLSAPGDLPLVKRLAVTKNMGEEYPGRVLARPGRALWKKRIRQRVLRLARKVCGEAAAGR